MADFDALTRSYRAAFLRYLPRHQEAALATGYELGRQAVVDGVTLLELASIHHDILRDVLKDTRPDDVADVASAASTFQLEVLALYDMTQRAFLEEEKGA